MAARAALVLLLAAAGAMVARGSSAGVGETCEAGDCAAEGSSGGAVAQGEEEDSTGMLQLQDKQSRANMSSVELEGAARANGSRRSCFQIKSYVQPNSCLYNNQFTDLSKVSSSSSCPFGSWWKWENVGGYNKIKNCDAPSSAQAACLDVYWGNQNPGQSSWELDVFQCRNTENAVKNQQFKLSGAKLGWVPGGVWKGCAQTGSPATIQASCTGASNQQWYFAYPGSPTPY